MKHVQELIQLHVSRSIDVVTVDQSLSFLRRYGYTHKIQYLCHLKICQLLRVVRVPLLEHRLDISHLAISLSQCFAHLCQLLHIDLIIIALFAQHDQIGTHLVSFARLGAISRIWVDWGDQLLRLVQIFVNNSATELGLRPRVELPGAIAVECLAPCLGHDGAWSRNTHGHSTFDLVSFGLMCLEIRNACELAEEGLPTR